MTLFIDSRESPAVRHFVESAVYPATAQTIKLDCADFLVMDNCPEGHSLGIERKTVTDLLASLGSTRLRSQLGRMASRYTHPVLLIEGYMAMSKPGQIVREARTCKEYVTKGGKVLRGANETGWSHAAVQMALFSVQRNYPELAVFWCYSRAETADVVRVLYQRGMKGCFNGRPVRAGGVTGARYADWFSGDGSEDGSAGGAGVQSGAASAVRLA